jgi:hypothetical protein
MEEIIHKLSFDFSEYKTSKTIFIDASSNQDILEVYFYNNGVPVDLKNIETELVIDNKVILDEYSSEKNVARFWLNSNKNNFAKDWALCEVRLFHWSTSGREDLATQNFLVYVENFNLNVEYNKNSNYLTRDDIDKIKKLNDVSYTQMPDPIIVPNGTIVQYMGEGDGTYITGYFYRSEHISSTFATWTQINVQPTVTTSGVDFTDHSKLSNRAIPNQHPITAINYLVDTLNHFANSELSDDDIDSIISEFEISSSEVDML